MKDQLRLLIEILFDPTAREDERHDAAMLMGKFDEDEALDALIAIGTRQDESDIVLDACGESIGQILINRNDLDKNLIQQLSPLAKKTADDFIKTHEKK